MPVAIILEQFEPPPGEAPELIVKPVVDLSAAVPSIVELQAANARMQAEIDALRSEKDAPGAWLPLNVAAFDANVPYQTAQGWAAKKKIASRRDGGRVFVTVNSSRPMFRFATTGTALRARATKAGTFYP